MFVPSFIAAIIASQGYPAKAPGPIGPVTGVELGPLTGMTVGAILPYPQLILTPAGGDYDSVTWSTAPETVALLVDGQDGKGIKILQQGAQFSVTAKINKDGGELATTTKNYTTEFATPAFTTQPDALSYYQVGGRVQIVGAAATPVTGYQWQKQSGTDWVNVAGQTNASFDAASGTAAMDGTYRLNAINGNKTLSSASVVLQNSIIFLQNDSDASATTVYGVKRIDNTHYEMVGASQTNTLRYLSGYIRPAATPTSQTGQIGVPNIAVTASDTTVTPLTIPGNSRSFQIKIWKVGVESLITAAYGNLSSQLKVKAITYATPGFATYPAATATVATGAQLRLAPTITSAASLPYTADYKAQWQKLAADGTTWENITGATTLIYTVASAAAANAGSYRCVLTNGDVNFNGATIVVTVS